MKTFPFVGRDADLRKLDAVVQMPHHGTPLVVVRGPGGVGKTALLTEWAGNQTQTTVYLHARDIEPGSLLHTIKREFQARPSTGVLVIDDADEVDEGRVSRELLAAAAEFPGVRVVVSTRNTASFPFGQDVELGPLPADAALALLGVNNATEADKPLIRQLADILGGHPLALRITASLLREFSPADVLSRLSGELYDLQAASRLSQTQVAAQLRPLAVDNTAALVEKVRRAPRDIFRLTPREFELLIAELLRDMGFDVHLTPQTHDGGVDVLAYQTTPVGRLLWLVEAKRYKPEHPVDVQAVRSLYGVFKDREANSALLVTSSRFTDDAATFASRHRFVLSLKEYADLVRWIENYGRKK